MATESIAAAGAEHASGGLPQFDFSWWAGEAIWTVAIFVVLLILFTKVFVPRVGGTIDEREDLVAFLRTLTSPYARQAPPE